MQIVYIIESLPFNCLAKISITWMLFKVSVCVCWLGIYFHICVDECIYWLNIGTLLLYILYTGWTLECCCFVVAINVCRVMYTYTQKGNFASSMLDEMCKSFSWICTNYNSRNLECDRSIEFLNCIIASYCSKCPFLLYIVKTVSARQPTLNLLSTTSRQNHTNEITFCHYDFMSIRVP